MYLDGWVWGAPGPRSKKPPGAGAVAGQRAGAKVHSAGLGRGQEAFYGEVAFARVVGKAQHLGVDRQLGQLLGNGG